MANKRKAMLFITKKGLFLIIFCALLIGAIGLYATHWSLRATSTTEFCVSCHSMQKPLQEWQSSKHFSNAKGIQAGCADCHIPHDNDWVYVKTKMTTGLKDVIAEIRGTIPDDAAYEEKRGEMAKRVWAEMEKNNSATCRSCHNSDVWDIYAQSDKAQREHQRIASENMTCISCHRGIAHFPPEFTEDADRAAGHLHELAAKTASNATALFPIAEIEGYADSGKQNAAARIFPSTALKVLASEGNMRQVQIDGFQQEGATQVIYAQHGKRIIAAVINDNLLETIIPQGDFQHHEASDANWRPVQFSAWISAEHMLSDVQALWDYGNELNNAYCGGCHAVIPAHHYNANQWPAIVNGMANRTSINENGKLVLTYYLQNHSKDATGANHD